MTLVELFQLSRALAETGFREPFPGPALVFSSRVEASAVLTHRRGPYFESVPARTDEFSLEGFKRGRGETTAHRPTLQESFEAARTTGGGSVVVFLETLSRQDGSSHEDAVTVGRGHENDICVQLRTVSVSHAKLTRSRDGWLIQDLDSHNGTYIDGRGFPERPSALGSGAWLSFGPEAHAIFLSPSALQRLLDDSRLAES